MSSMQTLIVGCGNIAGGFDRAGAASWPRTHAGAYMSDGRFNLVACVDPDEVRRVEFMQAWGISIGFRSIDEVARSGHRFDVISICSPTARHMQDVEVALELEPAVIFCEKPVASTLKDAQTLVHACERANVALAVNYTRRWDPSIADLRKGLEEQRWGPLRSVVGYYNKGLTNNGSHMLDLLLLLLGPLKIEHVGKPVRDFLPDDPSLPVWLETGDGLPVQLACAHAADFSFFELQLVFANAVITMEEGGLFWRERPIVESKEFPGYRVPAEGTRRPGGYAMAMRRSVGNIIGAMENELPLASTGTSALVAQKLCEEIRQS
jgi:predicted dehydrogenase